MAYNLETARKAAQQRGEKPPGGEAPGTPAYDQWVMAWFEAGLDAGDPDLVKRAGGGSGAGWGAGQAEEGEGGIAPWQDAKPSSDWLGKRAPSPRELRRYAHDQGWSEDFQRYDDRQLAKWLKDGGWDVQNGIFQGGVQKPTETGGVMAPGAKGGGGAGYPGGMGGLKTAAPAAAAQATNPWDTSQWMLNSPLAQMLANQGGMFRQYDKVLGDENPGVVGGVMQGGGVWYNPLDRNAGDLPAQRSQPGTVLPPFQGSPGTGGGVIPPGGPGKISVPGAGVPPAGGGVVPPGGGRPAPAGSLTNVMAPLQSGVTGGSPYGGSALGSALAPQQQMGQAGGLTGMMGKLNPINPRQKRMGSWF